MLFRLMIPALLVLFCGPGVFARTGNSARVVRVSSGDTIWVRASGTNHKVRIHGIDAPDRGQKYYARARAALKKYIGGRKVDITRRGTAPSGIVVVQVRVRGRMRGRDSVGHYMVARGHAWVLPGERGEKSYRALEFRARRKRLGLWRDKKPVPPWLFKPGEGRGCKIKVVKPKCK